MAKKKSQPTQVKKQTLRVITLSLDEIDRKIRKPNLPGTKFHQSKKVYNRKQKHPKQSEL